MHTSLVCQKRWPEYGGQRNHAVRHGTPTGWQIGPCRNLPRWEDKGRGAGSDRLAAWCICPGLPLLPESGNTAFPPFPVRCGLRCLLCANRLASRNPSDSGRFAVWGSHYAPSLFCLSCQRDSKRPGECGEEEVLFHRDFPRRPPLFLTFSHGAWPVGWGRRRGDLRARDAGGSGRAFRRARQGRRCARIRPDPR